jgi:hypothetical protein
MTRGAFFACWACCWLAACDAPIGHPPIARIELAPAAIPAHDEFQTAVVLDGSTSADPIDDPGGTEKLDYQWTIVDAEARFDAGSRDTSQMPTVRFRGERAATITLTVTDRDGNDSSSTKYLQLTVE